MAHRARRLVLAVACSVLFAAACDEETTLAKIDAPVRAEVRYVHSKAIGGSGNHFVCSPRIVEWDKVVLVVKDREVGLPEQWSKNENVALVSDPTGARLAYRKQGEAWRPVWVGDKRLLVGVDAQRSAADAVDWAAMPTLESAAPAIFRQLGQADAVLEELGARGPDKVAELLIATRDMDDGVDPWNAGYQALPVEQRARVHAALRADLVGGSAALGSLARYVRLVGLGAGERAFAVEAATKLDASVGWQSDALARVAVQSAELDAASTASWGCDQLRRIGGEGSAAAALLLAVAGGEAPCPAIEASVAKVPRCSRAWRCGDGRGTFPCKPDELATRVRARVDEDAKGRDVPVDAVDAAAMAAARTRAVPAAVTRGQARRDYPVDGLLPSRSVDGRGDACDRAPAPGQQCTCPAWQLQAAACSADGAEAVVDNCRIRIDDIARRIGQPTSVRAGKIAGFSSAHDAACAVAADETVQCWGDLAGWPLEAVVPAPSDPGDAWPGEGSPPPDSEDTLVLAGQRRVVPGVGKARKVVTGSGHGCALEVSGRVVCWSNVQPARVVLDKASDVAAGLIHACAIAGDKPFCWGAINMGQIPSLEPASTTQDTPTPVEGLEPSRSIAASRFLTCTLGAGVTCWGSAGQGTFKPSRLPGLDGAELLALSESGGCVVVNRRTIHCFTLGADGTPTRRPELVAPADVTALAASPRSVAFVAQGIGKLVFFDGRPERDLGSGIRAVTFAEGGGSGARVYTLTDAGEVVVRRP